MTSSTTNILDFIIKYLPIILVIIGTVAYFFQKYYEFRIKRRETTFTKIEENKILEIKTFYKSYHALYLSLKSYADQTEFGDHNEEIFLDIKKRIRENTIDFEYKSMVIRLFLSNEEIKNIDEMTALFQEARVGISMWHLRKNNYTTDKYEDKLTYITTEVIPNKIPALIKSIEESLRKSFEVR